ncbi:hypothetical protein RclHR1_23870003 [Rhizophagus clarus]|uniref:Uncharacterized protein n=1 Tax=Rhizophagus clarus TaxID=94130 RepID=A0A2Z6RA68_9GLOM|nr:hypothetical protein RclHR1_23870003 [Rhizophagus clarus]
MYDVQLIKDYTTISDDFKETTIDAKECNLETLIASRWYKDDIGNNVEISNNSSTYSFSYIQQIQDTIRTQSSSKEHLSKRKRYGKIYRLAYHVIQLAVVNDDQEPIQWIEQYIKNMEQQLEQIQSNSFNIIINKENTHPKSNNSSIQVNNLLVNNHTKGRSTKHARIKSAVEVLKKNGQNKRA